MPKSLSVKNIPNLCRKLAHRYMQAFYTDWVYKVFWHFLKMYPICVECLHIGICKHSTQIGYIRLTPIPFLHKLGTFSKMCPICVECLRIHIYILIFQEVKVKIRPWITYTSLVEYMTKYGRNMYIIAMKISLSNSWRLGYLE